MICNICGKNTDTRNGVCGECHGRQTVKTRQKRVIRQSTMAIIVGFVILVGLFSFISSGLFEETTEKVSETTNEIVHNIGETSEGIVKRIEEEQIRIQEDQRISDKKYIQEITTKVHELINIERTSHGLRPLSWNAKIAQASVNHSADMLTRDYFEHDSPEGHDFSWRYSQVGFSCSVTKGNMIYGGAENIMYLDGYYGVDRIASETVDGWMNSPGHKSNILTSYFQSEGIGVAVSFNEVYVTQNFC
jgi:uncharacterized protein YkwD